MMIKCQHGGSKVGSGKGVSSSLCACIVAWHVDGCWKKRVSDYTRDMYDVLPFWLVWTLHLL